MNAAAGDFLLPVDKPEGPTSHDVVAAARRALKTRKIGHTGTLDPFASGLLVLCVGRSTRLAEYVSGLDKRYDAIARLGVTTDTLDRCGEIVTRSTAWDALEAAEIAGALAGLEGEVEQVPPQFSAKKVGGEAMHRRARRGERVALSAVPVTIHEIELSWIELPLVGFTMRCSSGTYVRSVARDLGEALGVGAHLSALRRSAIGRFHVRDAIAPDELEDAGAVEAALIEPMAAVGHLPAVEIDGDAVEALRNGRRIPMRSVGVRDPHVGDESAAGHAAATKPLLVSVGRRGELLAIAEVERDELRPRKVFLA